MLRSTASSRSLRRSPQRLLERYCKRLLSTYSRPEHSDIVIVGGGPAGLALASALVSKPVIRDKLRITLVEAGDLSKVREWNAAEGIFTNRVSSVTNVNQTFLKDIGVWNHIDNSRTCPIEDMQVWDGISDARIAFSAAELNLEEGMSRITENLNLQRGLLRFLDSNDGVQILDKRKVQSISQDSYENGTWPILKLDNEQILRARLLVGADGFNSPVRSYAKISSFGWSYDTQAIVATLSHAPKIVFQGPNTTAYQRFLPTGPIAFLPLSPTASSLVWSTKPNLAKALIASEPQVLVRMINAAFRLPDISMRYLHQRVMEGFETRKPMTEADIREEILWREKSHSIDQSSAYASTNDSAAQGIPPVDAELLPPLISSIQPGTIASFPLRFNHADAYIGEGAGGRTALLGDAAHTVHPLAGQGLNLGLGDVECLARVVQNAVTAGSDIGSYTSLLPYTQERYFENHKLMSAMDKLHKLYSSSFGPIVQARSMGLELVNELDTIKAAIMITAGARPRVGKGPSSIFDLAASGIEGALTAANAAKAVRNVAAGVLSNGLSAVFKNVNGGK